MKKTVGDFEVAVTDPFPMWVEIKHSTGSIRFSHREILDLEYAVRAAKRHIAHTLPEEKL